jgi:hypothetical protein
MPRFYLNVVLGAFAICDNSGSEFSSTEAGKMAAMRAAGELVREQLHKNNPVDVTVDVKDEHGRSVFGVSVKIKLS